VLTLAIDTCESRGSIALRGDGMLLSLVAHSDNSDYSAWLLPSVDRLLSETRTKMELLDLLAVATGPGSFTGLRVGLTTVKAWSEVYGKPIVGVSRLEAMVSSEKSPTTFVAASYNAQRGQLFAGLSRTQSGRHTRIADELVISPEDFVEFVDRQAREEAVTWISLDPELIKSQPKLQRRLARQDSLVTRSPDLASSIGSLAEERASRGEFSDPLSLDANYVRRSDAEIFWKGPAANVP
jgi:tRNA threonylcarbamoyladenosine biosynthesis protein TsaB